LDIDRERPIGLDDDALDDSGELGERNFLPVGVAPGSRPPRRSPRRPHPTRWLVRPGRPADAGPRTRERARPVRIWPGRGWTFGCIFQQTACPAGASDSPWTLRAPSVFKAVVGDIQIAIDVDRLPAPKPVARLWSRCPLVPVWRPCTAMPTTDSVQ